MEKVSGQWKIHGEEKLCFQLLKFNVDGGTAHPVST
jgi:hypothetical protein